MINRCWWFSSYDLHVTVKKCSLICKDEEENETYEVHYFNLVATIESSTRSSGAGARLSFRNKPLAACVGINNSRDSPSPVMLPLRDSLVVVGLE